LRFLNSLFFKKSISFLLFFIFSLTLFENTSEAGKGKNNSSESGDEKKSNKSHSQKRERSPSPKQDPEIEEVDPRYYAEIDSLVATHESKKADAQFLADVEVFEATLSLKKKKQSESLKIAEHSNPLQTLPVSLASLNKKPIESSHNSAPPPSTPVKLKRLFGTHEHVDELVSLIRCSRKKLEIFSWALGFLDSEVFEALRKAANRGVEVILTVQEVNREQTLEALEDLGVQVNADRKTHTKFAVADCNIAIIGSCNFLGSNTDGDDEIEDTEEVSYKISDNPELVKRLRGRIYKDMISYEKGNPPMDAHLCVDLGSRSRFFLLTNLLHHQDFFKCAVTNAQERIIIYSPFVNYYNALDQLKVIEERTKPGVSLMIYVLPDHAEQMHWALRKCPKLIGRTKIQESKFHRKSLIIDPASPDNCLCSDGSHNWFSAETAKISNEACNQETTVVLNGPIAHHQLQTDPIDY